jgi:hypothetical protein
MSTQEIEVRSYSAFKEKQRVKTDINSKKRTNSKIKYTVKKIRATCDYQSKSPYVIRSQTNKIKCDWQGPRLSW